MDLIAHRQAIDEIDRKMVQLLNERTQHALAIGDIKLQQGLEIYAPHRENALLNRICTDNSGPLTNESLRAIYREIMSAALALEKTMEIAYFGPEATYTHQAAVQKFGASLKYVPQKTIADVFAEVASCRADYGVVPVENSTEGVVTHTLDMFVESELKIVAQVLLPIRHCLVGRVVMERIKQLLTHPQALAQCRSWVQAHLPHVEIIECSSTTRAAQLAAKQPDAAAIASSLAAERYGLEVLEMDLQDIADNTTRFLVLGRQYGTSTGNDRTSLLFSVRHEVGALHRALEAFYKFKLNMTKIESRPSRRKAWEYFFFVDCDGHATDEPVAGALLELEKQCNFVKILGSYPKA